MNLIHYSEIDHFDLLVDASRVWSQTWNVIRDITEQASNDWEVNTIDDLIRSEKVFDV